jgi:nitroreductase
MLSMFPEPVEEIIRRRTSWRTYNGEKISTEERQSLISFLSSINPLFGSELRFPLVDYESGTQKLSTYGFIKNACHFIVGGVKPGNLNIEDYGYSLEKIILYVTSLGLGTCWLGGFNKQNFYKTLDLSESEVMPAVTPVGYTQKNRGTFGKLVRYIAGSKNRKPWSELFFKPNFSPLTKEDAGIFAKPLEMVRLGPSASNGQPWRIVVNDDSAHFYSKTRNGYETMVRLDMGIALCHFDLTINETGINGEWIIQDPKIHHTPGLVYVATWRQSV